MDKDQKDRRLSILVSSVVYGYEDLLESVYTLLDPEVADRKGNWVQPYGPDDDARLFATAQFRRYRELAEKYLPRLKDIRTIQDRVSGGKS